MIIHVHVHVCTCTSDSEDLLLTASSQPVTKVQAHVTVKVHVPSPKLITGPVVYLYVK